MTQYRCTNFGNCSKADNKEIIESTDVNPSCPECNSTLSTFGNSSEDPKNKLLIIAATISIIITIAIIAYFHFHETTYSVVINSPNIEQGKIESIGTEKDKAINCSPVCTQEYSAKTTLTLTAKPNANFLFSAWTGDCAKFTINECSLPMDGDKKAGVIFKPNTPPPPLPQNDMVTIKVLLDGGEGVVTSEDKNINCASKACTQKYPKNTEIILTAKAKIGYEIKQWGDTCEQQKNDQCTIKLDANKSAIVFFEKTLTPGAEPPGADADKVDSLEPIIDRDCKTLSKKDCAAAIIATPIK